MCVCARVVVSGKRTQCENVIETIKVTIVIIIIIITIAININNNEQGPSSPWHSMRLTHSQWRGTRLESVQLDHLHPPLHLWWLY